MVEGFFIERFINTCISKKIFLWNVKRQRTTILNVNIGINNFRQVAKIAKQTNCKLKIVKKRGFPFVFNKYKKRKIFIVSFIIVVFTIIGLSNFVWNIEIEGNTKIESSQILQLLSDEGLSTGKFKSSVDTKQIINKIRLARGDIAWIGIEIKGTNALVKIVESDPKPEIINQDEYCNIITTKDGVIAKVIAQNGTPLLKEGEEIHSGDIVIGGWLEGKFTGIRYVHSEGEVWAKVYYTKKQKIPYNQTKEKQTGEKEERFSININNFQINFYKKLSNFEKYDTMSKKTKLKLFSNFYLPIEWIVNENYEKQEYQIEYTKEEAKQTGIQQIEKSLKEEIEEEKNILNKTFNTYEGGGYIEVEVTYEVLEEVGAKEKIIF